jgi:hypothetical protein
MDIYSGGSFTTATIKIPRRFRQRVLVIGFGNSGGEIDLDLANSGRRCRIGRP